MEFIYRSQRDKQQFITITVVSEKYKKVYEEFVVKEFVNLLNKFYKPELISPVIHGSFKIQDYEIVFEATIDPSKDSIPSLQELANKLHQVAQESLDRAIDDYYKLSDFLKIFKVLPDDK